MNRPKKKVRKRRGYRSHGWGITKGHRGKGNRGGVGNAGLLTRHRIRTWKTQWDEVGKTGFKRPQSIVNKDTTVNVSQIDAMVPRLLLEGKAFRPEEGEPIVINLDEIGYTKLLGAGEISYPLKIITEKASEKAKLKIKKAGGSVVLFEDLK